MIEEVIEAIRSVNANSEYFAAQAEYLHKMFEALKAVGFSDEAAVKIVAAQGDVLSIFRS